MKTKRILLLLLASMAAVLMAGCGDGSSVNEEKTPEETKKSTTGQKEEEGEEEGGEENVEYTLTDIILDTQFGRNVLERLWTGEGTQYDDLEDRLFVIRSAEDFERYWLEEYDSLPEIDFAGQSFLLIQGRTNNGVDAVNKNLVRMADGYYVLNAEVIHNCTDVAPPWRTAVIVTPAVPDDMEIELSVEGVHN